VSRSPEKPEDLKDRNKASEEACVEIRKQEYTRREAMALLAGAAALTGCRGLDVAAPDSPGSGSGATGDTTGSGINKINHVTFMFQENRSFDHYFRTLNDYRKSKGLPADADCGLTTATNPTFDGTGTVASYHYQTMCIENVSPAWNETHVQIDRDYQFKPASQVTTSNMNGFVYTAAKYATDFKFLDTKGIRAMGYYDHTDIPYYYWLTEQFAISDRWFSSVPANSPPNRLYSFAATSAGHVYPPKTTLSNKTIFHLLEEKGISWKIYVTELPFTYLDYFQPFADNHRANIVDAKQYITDAAAGTLPAVAFIEAGYVKTRLDEHPGNNIQTGSAYVATLINALMRGPQWKESVFFLSYDEGGGLYDHVPPPMTVNPDGIKPVDLPADEIQAEGDFTRYGLRVPFFAVSPYARKGFCSHLACDHTAILKFIEKRWGLATLTKRDAAQPDISGDLFNFSQSPNLNPPTPPEQPISGACYYDHLP
jgi:phospholipase C